MDQQTASLPIDARLVPFRLHRHLLSVADMVSVDFDADCARGRHLVERLAVLPAARSLLATAAASDFRSGFVCQAGHEVIASITLQRERVPGRWRILHLGVRSDWRKHGIGRYLVLYSLRELARSGVTWTVLEVLEGNTPALRLYQDLGFRVVCLDGAFERLPGPGPLPPVDPAVDLRPLCHEDQAPRYELARAGSTAASEWVRPVDSAAYGVGTPSSLWRRSVLGGWRNLLPGARRTEHCRWGAWQGQRLMGEVEVVPAYSRGKHRLRLVVHPEARGQLEPTLIARGLQELAAAPSRPVFVEHLLEHEAAVQALAAAGFIRAATYVVMNRPLTDADCHMDIPPCRLGGPFPAYALR